RESAYLILRHVSDGLAIAKAAKLPRKVVDFIPQHHGTRLIGHFFHRAKDDSERRGTPPPVEADFRYLGPRPQTREAALVMIADMVVALSRSLTSAAPEKLRQLVDGGIQAAVTEGQLDECELTLRDLKLIAESFVNSLQRLYARPDSGDSGPRLRVLEPELKRA
ncbi:MAG TPA: phosphohydrolase, partial [Myxococcales bacterium]|nr:phosphohydrolase [Myxococcales bacterium]